MIQEKTEGVVSDPPGCRGFLQFDTAALPGEARNDRKKLTFGPTCDVIRDIKINFVAYTENSSPVLSNAAFGSRIGPVSLADGRWGPHIGARFKNATDDSNSWHLFTINSTVISDHDHWLVNLNIWLLLKYDRLQNKNREEFMHL